MQRPLTLALVLAGVFFLGMMVGYTHVQTDYAHSLSFRRCCHGARTSAHRLIRYPFGGTSIVPFDVYGLGLTLVVAVAAGLLQTAHALIPAR
jgi:hypothetical protein